MAAPVLTAGSVLMCTFGGAGPPLGVLPTAGVLAPAPTGDFTAVAPGLNIPPFPVCAVPPFVCTPALAPWTPGNPTVLVGGKPMINMQSCAMCAKGGMVRVIAPAQFQAMV